MKTTPISVRLTPEDAAFLAGLSIPGATTLSEKLRALVANERRSKQGANNIHDAQEMYREELSAARRTIKDAEREEGLSSDFIAKLYERLPALMARSLVGLAQTSEDQTKELIGFEQDLMDDVFSLIQDILEFNLTSRQRCYQHLEYKKRIEPLLELLELINISKQRREDPNNG